MVFLFFLKKSYAERPWQRPLAKTVFLFFLKKTLCRASLAKAVGKDGFLFFKKISLPSAPCNYARQSWEHPS
jgi:hypothetical protein